MPHKHKRKRDDDFSSFDLAPTARAKPLAAYTKASIFTKNEEAPSSKRRKSNSAKPKEAQDDTPKAFARLMAWQATGKKPNGLDDGTKRKPTKKQRKPSQSSTKPTESQTSTTKSKSTETPTLVPTSAPVTVPLPQIPSQPIPKILPGETLSNFALRVDQTLPLTSISRSTNPNLPADLQSKLKKSQRTTKHNKRLQRMQADWRATETKLREKEDDENDELEDQKEEETLLWSGVRSAINSKKGKKKRGTKGDIDDDPWKELEKRRREETKQKNLQDVVKAPPSLKKVKSKFKTREEDFEVLDGKRKGDTDDDVMVDVGNVPNAVGSLRRREELNAVRRAVIEGYRKMHGRKRGVGQRLDLSRPVTT